MFLNCFAFETRMINELWWSLVKLALIIVLSSTLSLFNRGGASFYLCLLNCFAFQEIKILHVTYFVSPHLIFIQTRLFLYNWKICLFLQRNKNYLAQRENETNMFLCNAKFFLRNEPKISIALQNLSVDGRTVPP